MDAHGGFSAVKVDATSSPTFVREDAAMVDVKMAFLETFEGRSREDWEAGVVDGAIEPSDLAGLPVSDTAQLVKGRSGIRQLDTYLTLLVSGIMPSFGVREERGGRRQLRQVPATWVPSTSLLHTWR